jgi:hypothetical protein
MHEPDGHGVDDHGQEDKAEAEEAVAKGLGDLLPAFPFIADAVFVVYTGVGPA